MLRFPSDSHDHDGGRCSARCRWRSAGAPATSLAAPARHHDHRAAWIVSQLLTLYNHAGGLSVFSIGCSTGGGTMTVAVSRSRRTRRDEMGDRRQNVLRGASIAAWLAGERVVRSGPPITGRRRSFPRPFQGAAAGRLEIGGAERGGPPRQVVGDLQGSAAQPARGTGQASRTRT